MYAAVASDLLYRQTLSILSFNLAFLAVSEHVNVKWTGSYVVLS